MNRANILFVVNLAAGSGKHRRVERLIEAKLDKQKFNPSLAYTRTKNHATDLAKNAVANNFYAVVAVGGDGTVNEAGKALVGTKTALAFLPTGSGNGLARHLKIPMRLEKAMAVINSGRIAAIDTVNINGGIYIGMAGVGLDAHIGWKFSQSGKRGFWNYIKCFWRTYPTHKPDNYEIVADGNVITRKALLVSFANGSQYGNGATIAPEADLQDGLLDVCVLKDFRFYHLPHLTYKLFNKTLHTSKYLETFRAKEITIKQNDHSAHIDGEPIHLGKEISIRVDPLSLRVIVPQ
ncbi:MAG: hypothetical protein A2945_03215 [Candidatus Liptonbacteria bacterium RIFCSPLOWO2_01_FULL_52_25]|uniref:DAGKc domain-containing protein n=1 Tax=Candidatus Liptonbacteria bacterium RIFCSPLOWO2_01_FULL_52_25 TaxID=1798650 RepID=A0A1G2CFW3_9BACT|nr:MAG: hypothetical protein A2945_03215 [Candidatus Liptonbacteria bacterium RIFCSPLOWO2_01_FULL_52_25]